MVKNTKVILSNGSKIILPHDESSFTTVWEYHKIPEKQEVEAYWEMKTVNQFTSDLTWPTNHGNNLNEMSPDISLLLEKQGQVVWDASIIQLLIQNTQNFS